MTPKEINSLEEGIIWLKEQIDPWFDLVKDTKSKDLDNLKTLKINSEMLIDTLQTLVNRIDARIK